MSTEPKERLVTLPTASYSMNEMIDRGQKIVTIRPNDRRMTAW